ncbi:MAG: hypothetical protein ACPG7F_11465 [Aggregatilineales bacterium]
MTERTPNPDWYKSPAGFLDPEDYLSDKAHLSQMAHLAFTDPVVRRTVEYAVLMKLFYRAYHRVMSADLTAKQREAWYLRGEALRLGITPSRHVANQLCITQRAAQYRLQRAEAKMFAFEGLFAIYSEGYTRIPKATQTQIDAQLRRMTVACACDSRKACRGYAPARYGICWKCRVHYGFPHKMTRLTEDWLPAHVNHVRREAYTEAKAIVERRLIESTPAGKSIPQAM